MLNQLEINNSIWNIWDDLDKFIKTLPPVYWTDEMRKSYRKLNDTLYYTVKELSAE